MEWRRCVLIPSGRENYRQAKRIYARLGFPEQVDLVEVEGTHGVQPQNLAAIAQWMQRWLLDSDKPVPIAELNTRPPAELLCLDSSQVLTLPDERSVFDLNSVYESELATKRTELWKTTPRDEMLVRIRELLNVRSNAAQFARDDVAGGSQVLLELSFRQQAAVFVKLPRHQQTGPNQTLPPRR